MDKTQKEKAKQLADVSGKLANEVKGFAQRLDQAQKAQQQNGGDNGELQAKLATMLIESKAKADNARESHADRTAQKQMTWEAEEKRKADDHQLEMQRKLHEIKVDTAAKTIETATNVELAKKEAEAAPKPEPKSE